MGGQTVRVVLVADCNPLLLPRVGQGVGAVQVFLPRQNLSSPRQRQLPPIHPNNTPTYALVTQLVPVTGEFYTGANLLNAMELRYVL